MAVCNAGNQLAFLWSFKGLLRVEGVEGKVFPCLGEGREVCGGWELGDVCCGEGGEVVGAGGVDGFEEPFSRGVGVCCPLCFGCVSYVYMYRYIVLCKESR